MALENIVGNLRDAYALVDPETMRHSDEIQLERLGNPSLRSVGFYTADGCLYRMHNGKAQLGLTRRDHNLVLRHIDDAFTQLIESRNYHPALEEADDVFAAESTVTIDLNQLRLQGNNTEWRYLAIPTTGYDTLNPEERKLAERVHGSGDVFVQVMSMLDQARISETKVHVLNPSYIEEQTKKGPIERASWLNSTYVSSGFYADDRVIYDGNCLRGVRRRLVASASEPGAHEVRNEAENPFRTSYATILGNPEQAVAALDDTTASGLKAILSGYDTRNKI